MNVDSQGASSKVGVPLTILVPLALITCVAIITWWTLYQDRKQVSAELQQQSKDEITLAASGFVSMFERALRLDDAELIQERMAALGSDRETTFGVLTDETETVLYSMRLGDVGKTLSSVVPDVPDSSPFLGSEFLQEVRDRMGGAVNVVSKNHSVVATYPLVLGAQSGALRPNRVGNLILIREFSKSRSVKLKNVTRHALNRLIVISLLAIGLGLFFHFFIAKRLRQLAHAAEQFGAAPSSFTRTGVTGNDEVGRLAGAMDRMMADKQVADRAMAESKRRLQSILEAAIDSIITIDPQGIIQTANPATTQLFGYEVDEIIGKNISMLMPAPYAAAHDGYLAAYLRTGERKIIGIGREVEGMDKAGTVFPIDLSVSEVTTGDQRFFLGVVRDISERKKAEEVEISLGRLLEDSLNEIFIFDAETMHFIKVNRGARENLGYSMEELHELTPADIKPEHTEETFKKLVHPLVSGEQEKMVFETVHQRKNGLRYDVEVHLQLSTFKGRPAYIAIILDITESKKQRNELLTLATRLKLAVEGAQIGLWDWTFENDAVFFSREWKSQLGYAPDELEDTFETWRSKVHPEDVAEAMAVVENAIKESALFYENEFRMAHKDGGYRHIVANGAMLYDEQGNPNRLIGTHLDVTQRIEAAKALKKANEQLEERVRDRTRDLEEAQQQLLQKEKLATLGQVSGGIAHEIRNPLNAVKTSAFYLLNAKNPSPEKMKEHLERIDRQVTMINNVITALSDVAKMPEPKLNPFSVADSIRKIVKEISIPSEVDVVLSFPDDLPMALADEHQLPIVFRNLVRNARDAMIDGGTLTISASHNNDHVVVMVTDTGVGIAAKDLARIMEPLYSTKARGMGLGLAISQAVLEKNRGRLDVTSELGVGTSFMPPITLLPRRLTRP